MSRSGQRLIVPATTYKAIVGKVLQGARKARNFDQAAFAKQLGMAQPSLSRIESGSSNLTVDQLRQLAVALGLHPAEVLERADRAARALEAGGVRVTRAREKGQLSSTYAWLDGTALSDLMDHSGKDE